mgnify:CR=1 FL=1
MVAATCVTMPPKRDDAAARMRRRAALAIVWPVRLSGVLLCRRMREIRRDAELAGVALVLYLFEGGSQNAGDADSGVFVAYESGGRVLSFSMPPDPIIFKGDKAHPGWKERSHGRLLPGFVVSSGEEGVEVSGEMLSGSISLRDWSVDERGFLSQSRP